MRSSVSPKTSEMLYQAFQLDDHLKELTYSTVIMSLASKLPIQLQIDWGKFAYSLQPSLPSLRDFDKWIDIAVGAE